MALVNVVRNTTHSGCIRKKMDVNKMFKIFDNDVILKCTAQVYISHCGHTIRPHSHLPCTSLLFAEEHNGYLPEYKIVPILAFTSDSFSKYSDLLAELPM